MRKGLAMNILVIIIIGIILLVILPTFLHFSIRTGKEFTRMEACKSMIALKTMGKWFANFDPCKGLFPYPVDIDTKTTIDAEKKIEDETIV